MKHRLVAVLAVSGLVIGLLPAPASASTSDTAFDLAVGSATAYGTYDLAMSIPERPVPPVSIRGTLALNGRGKCAVTQIAYNGPADGIEWRTLATLCKRGKTNFRTLSSYLWGGARPQLRLCIGKSTKRAERGTRCDVYAPPRQTVDVP